MGDERATVVIGYDGSDDAAAAIRSAGRLLAPCRAIVAHVWESVAAFLIHSDVQGLAGSLQTAAAEIEEADARDAEAIAEQGAEIARHAGFDAVGIAAQGRAKAWPTLLEVAEQHEAAAIVVGARGRGLVASALFGSVSSGVLDHARLPVLIVPPAAEEASAEGPIVIGFDGSDQAKAAVEAAGRLFPGRRAVLQRVWASIREVAGAGAAGAPRSLVTKAAELIDQDVREAAERTVEEGVRAAAAAGLDASGEAVEMRGTTWRTLLDSVEEHHAAALVVGSRGRGGVGAALTGSVSRALVHHSPRPVLVVRPSD